jgi:signal transduction histidine kinase
MQFINDNSNFLYDALSNIKQFFDDSVSLKENDIFKENYLKYDLDYFINEAINALNETFEGIERVKKIVIAMKEFAHPSSKEKVQTDLNKIIETTITISRNNWKYYADMITQFDTNLPLIECVIDEIGQVILNMIVNSAHAIEEKFKELNQKGYIKITTSSDSSFAYITIEDNGTGIKPEHLSKIYEPFFTTKGVGKGTGQGLAIAYDIIVNKHNGDIKCESTYGEGTKFIIKLPLRSKNGKEV